jgi:hypothetical protein
MNQINKFRREHNLPLIVERKIPLEEVWRARRYLVGEIQELVDEETDSQTKQILLRLQDRVNHWIKLLAYKQADSITTPGMFARVTREVADCLDRLAKVHAARGSSDLGILPSMLHHIIANGIVSADQIKEIEAEVQKLRNPVPFEEVSPQAKKRKVNWLLIYLVIFNLINFGNISGFNSKALLYIIDQVTGYEADNLFELTPELTEDPTILPTAVTTAVEATEVAAIVPELTAEATSAVISTPAPEATEAPVIVEDFSTMVENYIGIIEEGGMRIVIAGTIGEEVQYFTVSGSGLDTSLTRIDLLANEAIIPYSFGSNYFMLKTNDGRLLKYHLHEVHIDFAGEMLANLPEGVEIFAPDESGFVHFIYPDEYGGYIKAKFDPNVQYPQGTTLQNLEDRVALLNYEGELIFRREAVGRNNLAYDIYLVVTNTAGEVRAIALDDYNGPRNVRALELQSLAARRRELAGGRGVSFLPERALVYDGQGIDVFVQDGIYYVQDAQGLSYPATAIEGELGQLAYAFVGETQRDSNGNNHTPMVVAFKQDESTSVVFYYRDLTNNGASEFSVFTHLMPRYVYDEGRIADNGNFTTTLFDSNPLLAYREIHPEVLPNLTIFAPNQGTSITFAFARGEQNSHLEGGRLNLRNDERGLRLELRNMEGMTLGFRPIEFQDIIQFDEGAEAIIIVEEGDFTANTGVTVDTSATVMVDFENLRRIPVQPLHTNATIFRAPSTNVNEHGFGQIFERGYSGEAIARTSAYGRSWILIQYDYRGNEGRFGFVEQDTLQTNSNLNDLPEPSTIRFEPTFGFEQANFLYRLNRRVLLRSDNYVTPEQFEKVTAVFDFVVGFNNGTQPTSPTIIHLSAFANTTDALVGLTGRPHTSQIGGVEFETTNFDSSFGTYDWVDFYYEGDLLGNITIVNAATGLFSPLNEERTLAIVGHELAHACGLPAADADVVFTMVAAAKQGLSYDQMLNVTFTVDRNHSSSTNSTERMTVTQYFRSDRAYHLNDINLQQIYRDLVAKLQ